MTDQLNLSYFECPDLRIDRTLRQVAGEPYDCTHSGHVEALRNAEVYQSTTDPKKWLIALSDPFSGQLVKEVSVRDNLICLARYVMSARVHADMDVAAFINRLLESAEIDRLKIISQYKEIDEINKEMLSVKQNLSDVMDLIEKLGETIRNAADDHSLCDEYDGEIEDIRESEFWERSKAAQDVRARFIAGAARFERSNVDIEVTITRKVTVTIPGERERDSSTWGILDEADLQNTLEEEHGLDWETDSYETGKISKADD